jgi:hypothetical protein
MLGNGNGAEEGNMGSKTTLASACLTLAGADGGPGLSYFILKAAAAQPRR